MSNSRQRENKQADEIKCWLSEIPWSWRTVAHAPISLVTAYHIAKLDINVVGKETPPTEDAASHMVGMPNLLIRKRERIGKQ